MFNNVTKLTKILYLDQKKSMQHVWFNFSRNTGSINLFSPGKIEKLDF